jgi:acylphosphatase
VGFRANCAREAAQFHGLRGWVRNLPDGRVEAVFCGDRKAVVTLVDWCRRGAPRSQVVDVEVEDEAPDSTLPPFEVKD